MLVRQGASRGAEIIGQNAQVDLGRRDKEKNGVPDDFQHSNSGNRIQDDIIN